MSVVVVHTTESDPGTCKAVAAYLVRMGYESHEVFDPSCDEVIQLLPASRPAKALVNLPGGVQTNARGGVYQIEVVGRAVDVPNYDDNWYATLQARLEKVCEFTGTPYVFPLPFEPYPQSYGNNLVRMTYDAWLEFEGICGHQHVPENDHGDPGALDVERLKEDDMPTPEEIWNHPLTKDGETYPAWQWLLFTHTEAQRDGSGGGASAGEVADELSRRLQS